MPAIPKTFYRTTNHKKPRHQLYIPGFNPANSCWLDGSWVTVPENEWHQRKELHQKLFQNCRKEKDKQHYRDPETPLDQMTEAQRMAWEHYSGQARLDVRYDSSGAVGPVAVEMAGNKPRPDQVKWMREQGMKIIRFTTNSYTGETTDNLKGLEFPEDLILKDEDPVDPWVEVVNQNKTAMVEAFYEYLEAAASAGDPSMAGFMVQMALTSLVEKEESIIRTKWDRERGEKDPYADLDRDVREYTEMRAKAEEALGENFTEWYKASKKSHNDCARANLGDSGVLFAFVLPEFHADGTHEPWGPRDVPWGNA